MRILAVGIGGVGAAFASILRRRSFFTHCALADYDGTLLLVTHDRRMLETVRTDRHWRVEAGQVTER